MCSKMGATHMPNVVRVSILGLGKRKRILMGEKGGAQVLMKFS